MTSPRSAGLWLLFVACGCTSTSTTNTARTSTEQLLVSNAIDGALDKVNFSPFAGSKVYLEEKYLEGVDGKYLVASVRHRALHAGARLVDKPEDADLVVELRSGGIGTASSDAFIGTPSIGLPGMLTIPEVKLVERKQQQGAAKIGMVAYDAKTREILGGGGVALNKADDSNWFIVGVGPWQSGSVREEVETRTSGPAAVKKQTLPAAIAVQGVDRGRPIDAPPSQPGLTEDVRYASFPADGARPMPPVQTP
jgi:hypothetical protein